MFEPTSHIQKEANLSKINEENVCVHHKIKQTHAFILHSHQNLSCLRSGADYSRFIRAMALLRNYTAFTPKLKLS